MDRHNIPVPGMPLVGYDYDDILVVRSITWYQVRVPGTNYSVDNYQVLCITYTVTVPAQLEHLQYKYISPIHSKVLTDTLNGTTNR